jgi:lysylphosphatidylglycerol synthetase-like protein (DUF2156 family)
MQSPDLVRRLGALLTAVVGGINILSALYPAIPGRMELLRDVLPLHLIRSSQTATVLVGFLLILLADGLRKRRQRALQLTVALLLLSSVLHLAKGLDFEEAIVTASLASVLIASRRMYSVPSALPVPHQALPGILLLAVLYYAYLLAGFFVLRHAIWPAPRLAEVSAEPWRLLFALPFYHYASPQARWFERSLSLIGCLAILGAGWQVLRPFIPRRQATAAEIDRVRSLVRRFGSDTLSYFALQHGRSHYFDESGQAFLSYRLWGSVALVGGHPIGAAERIPGLISAFLGYCSSYGLEPCFVGIAGTDLAAYHNLGLRTLKIGEEALVDLPSFDTAALKRKVRRAARHCEELGIEMTIARRDQLPADVLDQMHAISRDWIGERGGSERGFSMTLGRLPGPADPDCEIVLARDRSQLLGYLCVVPAYGSRAWSLDAMRRRLDAPNGLMEMLIIRAAESYRDRGYATLSLNFASLANSLDDIDSQLVDGARAFLYQHLSSVYQLRSLQQFNSKFQPRWQSRYLAYRDVLQIPKLAIAIAQSEDPISLPGMMGTFRRPAG